MTKAYREEIEELQRLKRELIKKHPELAGSEEREIPEFLRKHESLAAIKARIAKSDTEFSKTFTKKSSNTSAPSLQQKSK